jgi:hypothetical protein
MTKNLRPRGGDSMRILKNFADRLTQVLNDSESEQATPPLAEIVVEAWILPIAKLPERPTPLSIAPSDPRCQQE